VATATQCGQEDRYVRYLLPTIIRPGMSASPISSRQAVAGLATRIVTPRPHGGQVSRSKRQSRARHTRPERQHPARVQPAARQQQVSKPSPSQVLEEINRARLAREDAEAELEVLVDCAVDLGIGWPEIATQLGITRQAARQHYQRRHRDGPNHTDQIAD